MRRSIALKIFGIALLLLLLMGVVAAGSIFSVREVRDELMEIADCHAPVNHSISRINVHVLEQELHREHLLDLYAARTTESAAIARTRAAFEEKSRMVDQEVQNAEALLERCGSGRASLLEQAEVAHLQPMIQAIAKEQRDLRDLSARILALVERNETTAAAEIRSFLSRERDEFVASTAQLRADLQTFTAASLREAEQHEERIIWLSVVITFGAAASGLPFASLAASSLVRPIRLLVEGTQAWSTVISRPNCPSPRATKSAGSPSRSIT